MREVAGVTGEAAGKGAAGHVPAAPADATRGGTASEAAKPATDALRMECMSANTVG